MNSIKIQPAQSFNAHLKDVEHYPSADLIDEAQRKFAEWYLFRNRPSLTLTTVRCWLDANFPAFDDKEEHLLWEIWDGFSEFLPESY